MSGIAAPDRPLLPKGREGETFQFDAVPVAAQAHGEAVISAWGDGRLRIFRPGEAPEECPVHDGAILSMAVAGDGAVLTGGDDGLFAMTRPEGGTELARFPRKWVDHVAVSGDGAMACSVGKEVHLFEANGRAQVLEHPSTVGGIAFDPKGGRLAVAHYGGVTIWSRNSRKWKSSSLKWAGSHIRVTWSPDSRFLMTSMQENALHGWRLRDKADLRMSGYPGKVLGLAWIGARPWLATTGAEEAILWPFDGVNGPMGQGALALCQMQGVLATAVCGLPGHDAVLAGFANGAILGSGIAEGAEPMMVQAMVGAPIVAMAVTPKTGHLFAANDNGEVFWGGLLD